MTDQESKTALVTGASRGIGAAVAERLAADGFQVAINYMGSVEPAQALARKIEEKQGRARPVQADVTDARAVGRMFDEVEKAFGVPAVLVNCAGLMLLGKVADMDDDAFDRVLSVNLKGTFNTLREAARRMPNGGRIINFSSSVVGLLQPSYAAYGAAKAGVEVMTKILARELRGRSITVNTLAPGPMATELFFHGKSPELIAQAAKAPPLERLGTPDDAARIVSFLAGPDGAWINGQNLRANGGVI